MRDGGGVVGRVAVRPVTEADRARFVELFGDERFMVYLGALSPSAAQARFDHMLATCASVSFAKQAIVELSSGTVVGYTGVDWFDIDGRRWLEWGYRLVPEARGRGYATEATRMLLDRAARDYRGEILAMIHPDNLPSQNVCRKLGFRFWRTDPELGNLYLLTLPEGGR